MSTLLRWPALGLARALEDIRRRRIIYALQAIVTLSSTKVACRPLVAHTTTGLGSPLVFPITAFAGPRPGLAGGSRFRLSAAARTYSLHAVLNTGVNFWTDEPEFAVSCLAHGWDLAMHAVYQINATKDATGYTSGNVGVVDLIATKKPVGGSVV